VAAVIAQQDDRVLPSRSVPTRIYYYHNDHLGTPLAVTDESGQVVWRADYEPFGEATVTTSEIENQFRFPGQYRDEETGLHQNWFREYAAGLGRYLEPDPMNDWILDLYFYAGNSPLAYTDRLGLFSQLTATEYGGPNGQWVPATTTATQPPPTRTVTRMLMYQQVALISLA